MIKNAELIAVLRDALWREHERIRRAEAEIWKLKLELLELGDELPLEESERRLDEAQRGAGDW